MHNQAKSSVTSSLEKVQAGKEKKEQELAAAHQALEETNKKLQVCLPSKPCQPLTCQSAPCSLTPHPCPVRTPLKTRPSSKCTRPPLPCPAFLQHVLLVEIEA